MKVIRPWLVAPRTIEYREQEIHLTPETVLVRHVCTAPSQGTAIHRYRGEEIGVAPFSRNESGGPFPYPWLQGFAYGVGRIEEAGANVQEVEVGRLVYSQKLTAELSVLTPSDLIPLPEGLDPESATMLLQAEVGLKGARGAEIILGDIVFVTGQGPIGSFAAQLCKLAGAYQVIVTDIVDARLDMGKRFGATDVINAATEDVIERVKELTNGELGDVVVDACGVHETSNQTFHCLKVKGTVCIFGMPYGDPVFPFDWGAMYSKLPTNSDAYISGAAVSL